MIDAKDGIDTRNRPSFIPTVRDGGLTLDLERLSQTMAMLEDYVDTMLAMGDPLPGSAQIEENDLKLRVASL
ncbi:MAG: hypothetical protein M3O87_03830 [Candidatus Dormibacteraeota bacterium]|nr:hypothetical protein [Candidatus Dormibacteraeota bacterium]